MVQRYEILMLAVPELTQDESKQIEHEIDRVLRAHKATLISFERWGKYRLAYPVNRNDYGVYFLARFEIPEEEQAAEDIKSLFAIKLNRIVMRYLLSKLPAEGSLSYQRPKSLEESPTSRDVNAFLKENKMEGLLSSVEGRGSREEKPAAQEAEQAEAPSERA